MTDAQVNEFLARFGRAFFSSDAARLEEVLAPDACWQFAIGSLPQGRVRHGVEGFLQGKRENEALFADLRYDDVLGRPFGDDGIVLTYRVSGRRRADGSALDARGVELITVRDGRLVLKDVYWKQTGSAAAGA